MEPCALHRSFQGIRASEGVRAYDVAHVRVRTSAYECVRVRQSSKASYLPAAPRGFRLGRLLHACLFLHDPVHQVLHVDLVLRVPPVLAVSQHAKQQLLGAILFLEHKERPLVSSAKTEPAVLAQVGDVQPPLSLVAEEPKRHRIRYGHALRQEPKIEGGSLELEIQAHVGSGGWRGGGGTEDEKSLALSGREVRQRLLIGRGRGLDLEETDRAKLDDVVHPGHVPQRHLLKDAKAVNAHERALYR